MNPVLKRKPNLFDDEVNRVLTIMSTMQPESKEYRSAAEALSMVCEARKVKPTPPVSPDVVVSVVANLIGIVLILKHEDLNVITSKAVSFIYRAKV